MHKDQARKDQAHKDQAHKDRAHKDRAHSLNSKMEKNEDFLKWTKISEVFPNLSPGEKVRTLDHFKNSNDMDIREFNIFQPGDQGLGHSSIINPGSIKNEDDTIDLLFRGEDTDASFSGYLMTDKASALKCTGTINNNNENVSAIKTTILFGKVFFIMRLSLGLILSFYPFSEDVFSKFLKKFCS